MKVLITIPQNIVSTCLGCGWEEKEIQVLFKKYMDELVEDCYNQFEINFDTWLEDLDEEELEQEFQQAQEEEDFPRICE